MCLDSTINEVKLQRPELNSTKLLTLKMEVTELD